MRPRHRGGKAGRKVAEIACRLPLFQLSRIHPPRMTDERTTAAATDGTVYRVTGALTITRAASTQRELDDLPDPLTIDLSEVTRMDTVGAWFGYGTIRDRGAKCVGASRDEVSLLRQVADFDKPARVVPEQAGSVSRAVGELGMWVVESGQTLKGLL